MAIAEKEASMEKYVVKLGSKDQSGPKPGEVVYIGIDQGQNKWVYAIRWGGQCYRRRECA
jgi:hypothetical protein